MAEVRMLTIPSDGGGVPARLYRPLPGTADGVLVWLHGGGCVLGSLDGSDDQARGLANASGCAVLSVDYRLAPEHRFPAGLEDAYAAVSWAAAHPDELGVRPCRVAIGGDSAGGNLAAAVALLARDRGGPPIELQLLVYPVTCQGLNAPSWRRYADGHWLTAETMNRFWEYYLDRAEGATHPYASPLRSESLADLPPAVVLLAECDVLHDEGARYAQRLEQAGIPTQLHCYEGMIHGFMACGGVVERAWEAWRVAGEAVGDALRANDGEASDRSSDQRALSDARPA
jgi:acetyl esterase